MELDNRTISFLTLNRVYLYIYLDENEENHPLILIYKSINIFNLLDLSKNKKINVDILEFKSYIFLAC